MRRIQTTIINTNNNLARQRNPLSQYGSIAKVVSISLAKSPHLFLIALFLFASTSSALSLLVPHRAEAATTLNFTELATHPQAASQPTEQGRTINNLKIFNGKLYAAYGDYNANTGPISINPFDLDTNTFDGEALSVPTEALGNWKVIDGKLYTTTIDPTCSGTCSGGYAVGDSSHNWEMKTPVNAEHIFDINTLNGNDLWLFGSTGGASATAWRSTDGGNNWEIVRQKTNEPGGDNTERYYWSSVLNGSLYMRSNLSGYQNPIESYNGSSWTETPSNTTLCESNRGPGNENPVVFRGKIVCRVNNSLQTYDGQHFGLTQNSPGWIQGCNPEAGDMIQSGNFVNVLCVSDASNPELRSASIVQSSDLVTWREFNGIPNSASSIVVDENNNQMYVGTTDSKIYVADLPEPDVIPPEVSITSPTAGTIVDRNIINLAAAATDSEYTINKVEFYLNGELIGEDSTAPYTNTFINSFNDGGWFIPNGVSTVTAKAFDFAGNHKVSDPININVQVPNASITELPNIGDTGLGLGPSAMVSDSEGNLWFNNFLQGDQQGCCGRLGRIDAVTNDITYISLPDSILPAILGGYFGEIMAIDENDRLWFASTDSLSITISNVYRYDTKADELDTFDIDLSQGIGCNAQKPPYNVLPDNQGNAYITCGNFTNGGMVAGKVSDENGLEQIELPNGYMYNNSTVDNQGRLILSAINPETFTSVILRMNINGVFDEIISYTPESMDDIFFDNLLNTSMAVDQADNIWITGYPINDGLHYGLSKISPHGAVIRYGDLTDEETYGVKIGTDGNIWFSNRDIYGIEKLDINTGIITSYGGLRQSSGDENSVGRIDSIDFDKFGNLYSTDIFNLRILKLSIGSGSPPNHDTDSDGLPDSTENAGPNNGDANNDGIPDSEQAYVTSFVSSVTGKYVTVVVDSSCTLSDVGVQVESALSTKDTGFDYQTGLVRFTATGCQDGQTTATIYYHDTSTGTFSLRKYNPNTKAFFTVETAQISKLSSPLTGIQATYSITDGGDLDTDGQANGTIVDPVGLGTSVVSAPNTGFNTLADTGDNLWYAVVASAALITTGTANLRVRKASQATSSR
jgi:streptogramin lyase